jgi:hypothetical protein
MKLVYGVFKGLFKCHLTRHVTLLGFPDDVSWRGPHMHLEGIRRQKTGEGRVFVGVKVPPFRADIYFASRVQMDGMLR